MGFKNFISSFILKFSTVKMKSMDIDHHKYLGRRENSLKIYDRSSRNMILSPFNMVFDPIDRLLVVKFEQDSIYYSIELQIFHKMDKEYPLVIMYRKDNMMDIYYTSEIVINNKKEISKDLFTNISYNQLENIEYKFQFDDIGLDAYLFLKDKLEQEIEFKIKENTPDRELSSILAPISAINKKPEYFPIVFLNKFSMVIKKNTEFFIKIHGIYRTPTEMPLQINGKNVYQAYYSLKPIISNWNNNFNGKINPIILNPPNLNVLNKSFSYDLINNSDYYEIKHISGNDEEGHSISFEFSPAIPNLLSLRSKSKMRGKFSCIIDKKIWIFAGKYYLNRTGDTILFKITPTKGWQPLPGKLWLKSYKWTSKIEIRDIGNIIINSYWRRING